MPQPVKRQSGSGCNCRVGAWEIDRQCPCCCLVSRALVKFGMRRTIGEDQFCKINKTQFRRQKETQIVLLLRPDAIECGRRTRRCRFNHLLHHRAEKPRTGAASGFAFITPVAFRQRRAGRGQIIAGLDVAGPAQASVETRTRVFRRFFFVMQQT